MFFVLNYTQLHFESLQSVVLSTFVRIMKNSIYYLKFWHLWIVMVLFYTLVSLLSNIFIFTDNFYYNSLLGRIASERIRELISFQKKFQYVGYIFIPLILLLKVALIAGVIFIGTLLISQDIYYKNCLKITLVAEVGSLISTLVGTVWLIIDTPETAETIQNFRPLSVTQFLNIGSIPKYLFYPLQFLNVFEVIYWILLAHGIMAFTNFKFGKSLRVVAGSYGVALFIWAVFIVFIQVQFT